MFQTKIQAALGTAIRGEIYKDGPIRAAAWTLVTDDPVNAPIRVGCAFTYVDEGIAKVGGNGLFVGILTSPKQYASYGGADGPLSPTLDLPMYSVGELLTMGIPAVYDNNPAGTTPGNSVAYSTTTGELTTVPAGSGAPAGSKLVPNAKVDTFKTDGPSVIVISLTN